MRKIVTGLALLLFTLGSQASSLLEIDVINSFEFEGYDGEPATVTGVYTEGELGTVKALAEGIFTATYLGSESDYDNFFQFGMGDSVLTKESSVGDSISMGVEAGIIDFSFANDVGSGTVVKNGDISANTASSGKKGWLWWLFPHKNDDPLASFAILEGFCDDIMGCFEYVLGFNDQYSGDADFDDFVVGINLSAHPAPVPLPAAAWLFGSALLGFGAAARRKARKEK